MSNTSGMQPSARRRTVPAAFLMAMTLAGTALAGALDDGVAAYDRGDYATALQLLQPLANARNVAAQYNLGHMYALGEGVQQDYAEAAKWFRKAADQGEASAQLNLGVMYSKGQGVPQDYGEAGRWFRRAADQREAKAQFNLGLMYDKGQGVPQDYTEAGKWYREAAEQGDARAEFNLGVMYTEGQGMPPDYVEAYKWLNLAAFRFPASEAGNRERAIKRRDSVASKMTPQQIAEAQKLAREWKPTR